MNKGTVLVVEDDKAIQNLIGTTLEIFDYNYLISSNAKDGILKATSYNPDVIILDLGLPDMDGLEVIKKIRSFSLVPIIIVSARTDNADKITALDAGADDYLTKPFSTDELLARLRVSLRRAKFSGNNQNLLTEVTTFTNGWLKINYLSKCVFVNEKEIHLTPIEYKLLCLLAENLDRVMTYNYLVKEIWGYYEEDFSALRVFANTLRKKIELDSNYPKLIQTHIGVGYRMIKID